MTPAPVEDGPGRRSIPCSLSRYSFLDICGVRQYIGHLTKEHHIGFEANEWL
ncbi:putative cytochrome-c oxidase [Helianthus annuus]|uniref:Cytochrome-c oxidase n=1 Tax=Helianthus annuus TaxID=4232 RepID=A0A251SPL0_HELAN|nr:putative cytochrome-c oxidase [Helianthus annuus]KAJ0476172.1 putative cytochrome-c oxidase [Helianthus annuus]KAJ0496979.1 putative cytochrome-c oxidase [Helianthus annuus]KAJ0663009.1 putative cytochrome-c oxidase [Helianthus annuus]KAJ0848378.1 putative cytochrome-c oxidase [Helianthus annuus]